MLVHWVWLSAMAGISDRQKLALLERFHDPEQIYLTDEQTLASTGVLTEDACKALQNKTLSDAEHILEQCEKENILLLPFSDAAYPTRLRNIADPPPLLYYKGRLPDLSERPVIGIVGTRKASLYGLSTARRMGCQIGACGAIVASGMAYGIDAAAMRGALDSGRPVVGVLGCGVDVIYPRSNRALFEDMAQSGCLLSEFAPATPPASWNFPRRNRIISGLSCGVLVVEAPEKSGALITANQALEQGRDVFVVPGNIDVPSCAGSNALLRDGAIAVTNGWDVVSEYENLFPGKISKDLPDAADAVARETAALKVAQVQQTPKKTEKADKKAVDKAEPKSYSDAKPHSISLSDTEQKLLTLIGEDALLVDDLIARSRMGAGSVLAALTMLRIKGVVTMLSGGYVKKKWENQ